MNAHILTNVLVLTFCAIVDLVLALPITLMIVLTFILGWWGILNSKIFRNVDNGKCVNPYELYFRLTKTVLEQ